MQKLFDELRCIPKEYAIILFLKLFLAVAGILTFGALLVFITALILFKYHFSTLTIAFSGLAVWLVFILIIAGIMFYRESAFTRHTDELLRKLRKEMFTSFGLYNINRILRKLKHYWKS